jgi:hydrogenase maturation protease
MNEFEWQLLEDKNLLESCGALKVGDTVRLRPRPGGDIFDMALAGQIAVIESIEQDYEGKAHLAVILEDDPGKDLGMLRQPGHRFFFTPEEVEAVATPSILVACIGNIFLGDDAFGVEVARRLMARDLPSGVKVTDFGIRGFDLAYALLEPHNLVILVDACPRGSDPGTLYVIEPEVSPEGPALDAHTMNPVAVLRLAHSMGAISSKILLVGCEPADLGGEEGSMGLSAPVSAAVNEAVHLVEKLIEKERNILCKP